MDARSMTNRKPATCGHCGAELAAHRGRVWRDRVGAWHCTCLDASVCKTRLTPPRLSREDLVAAVHQAIGAGALVLPVEDLAARARGESLDDGLADLVLSQATEAALAGRLPAWPQDPRAGRLRRHTAAPQAVPLPLAPPIAPRAPARRPGAARRARMACPTCGAVAVCYSDVLGVQHWQCMTCLGAGRPSCWDTCTTCGHRTEDLVAPWVCPGCGRDRRPAPVAVPVPDVCPVPRRLTGTGSQSDVTEVVS